MTENSNIAVVPGSRFTAIPPVAPKDKRPFWSVLIPVYNRTKYLPECLNSVLAQWTGEEEMEILVIDNASTPPLFELVNSLGKGIVRYYRHQENVGLVGNFNVAIALSRGQWIHLLHDDDYVLPGFYSKLKQSLDGCSESVGAAFTGYENINEKNEVIFSQQVYGEHKGIASDWLAKIGVSNPLNPPAVVIRRSAYERLGGYHSELTFTTDWELYKRIATFYDWWYEPDILARYREHPNNITAESSLSGSKGTCLRRAIEISTDYIPIEITAKSRKHHFDYCLREAVVPLHFGQIDGALRLLKEALKIDQSTEALTKLFAWLKQDEAAPLRSEITLRLLSLHLE
jgi:protein O-GlcNAc transferase